MNMSVLLRCSLLVFALAALPGCAPMITQSPGMGYSPVNAVSTSGFDRLLLGGTDVVAYFDEGRQRSGSPAFHSEYKGVSLLFASAEHKALFDADPPRYLPQFGGYCANGIAYGIPWGGDADTWALIDGRLYVFGGAGSRDAFMLDPVGNLALARRYWDDEVDGSNALVQRMRRLLWRVPHYKSGAELAAAVAAAHGR